MSGLAHITNQKPKEKSLFGSLFESIQNSLQASVTSVGSNALSRLLTSEPVARGAETLLLAHPVAAVNILHQNLKRENSDAFDWEAFCTLQVQFQAFTADESFAHLEPEQRTFISETSGRLEGLRRELQSKSAEERNEGLAELRQELPELTQKVGLVVQQGSLAGKIATTVGDVFTAQAKQTFPFLFKSEAPVAVATQAPVAPPTPDLNWRHLAVIEKDKMAQNGAGFCAARFACESLGGLDYNVQSYREMLANGSDELKTNVLRELRAKEVSWVRYFVVWCLFSIAHSLISRYIQRIADAYFREVFAYLKEQKNQKYEPLIHTSLENGAEYYFAFNQKLAHGSNLNNGAFQRGLELPKADDLYAQMGNELIKKSGMNCVFVWVAQWFVPSPKEMTKMALTSFTDALHAREYGFNQMLFPMLGYVENVVREQMGKPRPVYPHTRERLRLVEGFVRNLTDAALLASCKTPTQVASGVTERSFPADPLVVVLEKIPTSILSVEARKEVRIQSQEELVRRSIISFADTLEEVCQEKPLQRAVYEMLAAANTFFTPTPPVMTPEQLDLAVRERAINLCNLVITHKLQLPEAAAPYFTEITSPIVNSFLTLGSNSLQPAFFQRILLDAYLKNR